MSTPVILRPCSDEELGPDAVTQKQELVREMKESRYMSGMQIDTGFQSYKLFGEAVVRMGGMAKNFQQVSFPFGTFLIH
jgi:hypothetical protein